MIPEPYLVSSEIEKKNELNVDVLISLKFIFFVLNCRLLDNYLLIVTNIKKTTNP